MLLPASARTRSTSATTRSSRPSTVARSSPTPAASSTTSTPGSPSRAAPASTPSPSTTPATPADDNQGTLTRDHLSGLDLADAGVGYLDFEELDLALSTGNDTLTIDSTHAGSTRTTLVSTGAGNDTVNVETISGPTTVLLGAGNDTVRVGDPRERRGSSLRHHLLPRPRGRCGTPTPSTLVGTAELADLIGLLAASRIAGLGMTLGGALTRDEHRRRPGTGRDRRRRASAAASPSPSATRPRASSTSTPRPPRSRPRWSSSSEPAPSRSARPAAAGRSASPGPRRRRRLGREPHPAVSLTTSAWRLRRAAGHQARRST